MSDDPEKKPESPQRREFLGKVTGVIAGSGVTIAALPFISSMNPSADVVSNAVAEVDLRNIPEGDIKTVSWQGKPVFIMHRTPKQISAMQKSMGGKDPQPDAQRVQRPEWLVVIGICTHLGCVPNRKEEGWFCPCHGSVYDDSGRILRGPAPTNLKMPVYRFTTDDSILIGKV